MTVRRVFLGLDCGTQSTRALMLDAESSAVVAVGRAPHQIIERADGTREQHPDWWTDAVLAATADARQQAGAVEVAGIGVSGQQHGLVCLGSDDRPVRTAKLWNDTTTAAECGRLTEAVGGPAAALRLTGNSFLPGYTAPKVAWLRRHEPDTYAATRRMCLPHDYLNLWLCGAFATEPGDASGTAYVDVRTRQYSSTVLDALDGHRDWDATLPPIVPSLSVLGQLRPTVADALGLSPSVPVSAGGGDNMLAAIGVGAVVEGPVVVSLGTSGTAFAYRDAAAIDPRGEAAAFCDSTGGWLPLVCTLNCTVATEWVRGLFGLDHAALERSLAASPVGARGVTFVPHLEGERTPNCPGGAGVLSGLRAAHEPADIVRGVLEGVTFGLEYALHALRRSGVVPTEITLVGGGARSDGWAQLCADVFGLVVRRPPETDAGALGGALQARWAVDGTAVTAGVAPETSFEPRANGALDAARERAAHARQQAIADEQSPEINQGVL